MQFIHTVFVEKRVGDCKNSSLASHSSSCTRAVCFIAGAAGGSFPLCSQDCEPPRAIWHGDSTLHICHHLFMLTAFTKSNQKVGNEVSLLCSHFLQVSQEVVGNCLCTSVKAKNTFPPSLSPSCLWLEEQHFRGVTLSHLAQQELPILFPLISPVVALNNTMEYLCVSVRSRLLSKTHRK